MEVWWCSKVYKGVYHFVRLPMDEKVLNLISPWQTEAIKCLVIDGKKLNETAVILQSKGYDISLSKLKRFHKDLASIVVETEKLSMAKEYLLGSIGRVTEEFEDLNAKTKKLLDDYEKVDNKYLQLVVIKELREQIKLALVKMGEYKNIAVGINTNAIITSQEIVDKFRKMQVTSFDSMDVVMEDGHLIYRNPSVEMIDSFNRYKAIKTGLIKSPDSDGMMINF